MEPRIIVIAALMMMFILASCQTPDKPVVCSVIQGIRDGMPGQKGEPGLPGENGAPGLKGSSGIIGKAGPQGLKGQRGETGDKGEKGSDGRQGLPGHTGSPGSRGDTGAPGTTGPQGHKGDQGHKGSDGKPGTPASLDPKLVAQLENMNKRISALESVLILQEKMHRVNKKILATNGKEVVYETARKTCSDAGGRMATPLNKDENDAMVKILTEYNRYAYLGYKEKEIRSFKWTIVQYVPWALFEPNGDGECVELFTDGTWNDKPCNYYRLVVCEF